MTVGGFLLSAHNVRFLVASPVSSRNEAAMDEYRPWNFSFAAVSFLRAKMKDFCVLFLKTNDRK